MSTLVTGATGFLGRHIMRLLPDAVGVGSAECDLRGAASVSRLFNDVKPTAVIHAAARCGGIGANRANPARFHLDNAVMGLNIVSACCSYGIPVTVIGTTCSYPAECPEPFEEERLFDGYPEPTNAPYGIAKRSLLSLLWAAGDQYSLRWSYPILANLYGPGDRFGEGAHCIPHIIEKIATAKHNGDAVVTLWGDGSPTRDFLFVEDAAKAVVLASASPSECPVNFGTGRPISIRKVAEHVAAILGYDGRIEFDCIRPNGQLRRSLSTRRAESLYNWRPETDFETGLSRTIDWWQINHTC